MKKLIFLFFLSTFFFQCKNTDSSSSAPREVKSYTIDQFLTNTNIYGRSFSHDEKELLAGSNETGIYNAYSINLESGERKPLTTSDDESVWVSSYFPHDNRFLYTSDNGGDEIDHIFLQNEDGTTKELTPDEGAKASFAGWSDDLKTFFYMYNKRDKKYMDMYEMDIENFQSTLIYKNEEGLDVGSMSNNKRYLALTKTINTNDSDLFLFDRETKKMTKINDTQSKNRPADFSVDSKYLYFLTDAGNEFQYLMKYDIEAGTKEKSESEDWDISYAYFSKKGKYQVIGINQDAKTVVKVKDTSTGKLIDFPDLPNGDISSVRISRSENKMIFSAGSSRSTNNLYYYDLQNKSLKQLTTTLNPEINPDDLVEAEVVRYPSFDKLEIPAIFYKPHTASSSNLSLIHI